MKRSVQSLSPDVEMLSLSLSLITFFPPQTYNKFFNKMYLILKPHTQKTLLPLTQANIASKPLYLIPQAEATHTETTASPDAGEHSDVLW